MTDIEDDRPEPDSLAAIAAEHGVPLWALRAALAESHPDASPAEVIAAARATGCPKCGSTRTGRNRRGYCEDIKGCDRRWRTARGLVHHWRHAREGYDDHRPSVGPLDIVPYCHSCGGPVVEREAE